MKMMSPKNPIRLSQAKFKQLTDELEELVTIGKKLIADKLEQYRGDENTEENTAYSEVLEEKQWMDDRIRELERILENAVITEEKCDLEKVSIGCSVTVSRNGKKMTFTVVPSIEANSQENKISDESPMGKALIGKKVGEVFHIDTPEITCKCKVIEINKG